MPSAPPSAAATANLAGLEVLDRLEALLAELRTRIAPVGEPFAGLDPFDLLLAPLFVDAMNTVRTGQAPPARAPYSSRVRAWLNQRKLRKEEADLAARAAPVTHTEVLFWPREVTHMSIVRSAVAALDARGVKSLTVTCANKSFHEASQAGLAPAFAPAAWPQALRAGRAARRSQRDRLLAEIDRWLRETHAPRDRMFIASIYRTVRQKFELAALAVINAREALERTRPRVLVVGNDLTIEGRAGVRVAAQRGIPVVAYMHGALANNVLHARHCADRFLVHGPRHRDDLLRRGLSETQIEVIGAPYLDKRPQASDQLDPRLQAAFGLRPGEPWLLVATSGPGNAVSLAHHQQVVENLARLSAALPQVPLVIKLHRKDSPNNYERLQAGVAAGRVAISPYGDPRVPYDIFQWLPGCPLLLTGTSTVAVEAMLMQVPVITMDFCDEARGIDFIDEGATLHCRTGDELEAAVRQVLAGPAPAELHARAQAYVASAYYKLDGRAAERGADVICHLAARGTP